MTSVFREDPTATPAYRNFVGVAARHHRERRRARRMLAGSFLLALAGSAYVGEVDPREFVAGFPAFLNYFYDTMPELRLTHFWADLADWYWGIGKWLGYLWDTVLIAFLATLLGFAGAFVLCFPASENLNGNRVTHFLARRLTEFARSVPELVFALIFVFSFGIGPLPGVLAIALHSCGALGKLFSEINENIDANPMEGVRASGGNWLQMIRYAVVPQVLPNFMSYTLLRFEINVRAASVVGFVGAGGIGQELMTVIRQFLYKDISAIVLLIVITVSLIDILCEKFRHHLIGKELAS